jgi:hypothetical protein
MIPSRKLFCPLDSMYKNKQEEQMILLRGKRAASSQEDLARNDQNDKRYPRGFKRQISEVTRSPG